MSDQNETPTPKRFNVLMKFGAEMNDAPPPPAAPLPPPEEPANTDRKPAKKP
ncbi:hypothetical protein [Paracoccus chinensis]|uniref:Uncharacterized protein n=1 Tax=Paracoccus chinensis TaxID=525640 RepID=A0A1G9JY22_9RHOB|nr:hypothetical protein [Paracoccus chinensis]SDL42322.1 hypothetical protein SAMN04487971_11089 [Paracoccus chinensis]